ncbi:MAG TPA: NAD-dependent epimerase/dehydratase family protein [Nitrolancea sp.]|jgi:nucleoside-diphosphate-sugar epimerase|nr:NAD-dependent epimerase/dehydratase family protein [Nitrolancea sp.]
MMGKRVLVTGAGGFIGHHLVSALRRSGHWVRGVDLKFPEYEATAANEFHQLDLRREDACRRSVEGVDEIYHLAADMGGIGYITSNHATIAHNNTLIDINMLEASAAARVGRFLYASSACVYPAYRQTQANVDPLREDDAYPADPDEAYGWEKLYSERLCNHYSHDFGLDTRIVRLHNVYGPLGTYDGGREKAPAAMCRKVARACDGGEIEIWGDGEQTRSFMYVDDGVEGLQRIMHANCSLPINLGTERLISINELVDIVANCAGKRIRKRYNPSGPQGVRGRNSDSQRLRTVTGWEPTTSLEVGLARTYAWIAEQTGVAHEQVRLSRTPAPA